jgi:hypothetical protein
VAVSASAGIESDVVGYQSTDTREGFNYVTPTFERIDGETNTIHDLQMSADVGLAGADLQFLTVSGGSASKYQWVPAASATAANVEVPAGKNGMWALQTTTGSGKNKKTVYTLAEGDSILLAMGDGVQIGALEGNAVTSSGRVPTDTDVEQLTVEGFNYVGNAFPQAIDIQDIQMSAEVGLAGADLQFLTVSGGSASKYQWVPVASATAANVTVPEGLNGVWAVQTTTGSGKNKKTVYTVAEDVTIGPGESVQIGALNGNTVFVLCPYELD